MKIDITYDANGLNITLDYDHDAQKSFARAGEAADWFRRREGDEPTGDNGIRPLSINSIRALTYYAAWEARVLGVYASAPSKPGKLSTRFS